MQKENKGKITGIIPGIALIIGLIILFSIVNSTTKNIVHIEEILNVNDFYKNSMETISKEDLISKYGQPEKTENWNYTSSENSAIPLETLSYNNYTYEYIFKDNLLVRININKEIPFNSIKNIYTMFNLTKFDTTQEINTGSAIRIYNTSVPDFWCTIDKQNIKNIKITYKTGIFD